MTTSSESFLVKLSGQWWINVVYGLGAIALVATLVHGSTWEPPRLVAALFAAGLALHVLEKLNYPAGFHYMLNSIQNSEQPEVGPENRLSDLITNLGVQLLIVAVMIAGGNKATTVAFVLFGIGESIVHLLFGVLILRKLRHKGKRTIYGPGTITALLAFLPAAIYAWAWLTTQTVGAWDIAIGVLIIAFTMGIMIRLPMMLIDGRNHPELAYTSTGYFAKYLK